MKKLIGVLAGMGPRSTAPFLNLVLDECQRFYGAKNDIDFPPMMIYSLPTPFFADRPINHRKMEETIICGLKKLEENNVQFIAMPCNTAHVYFESLKNSIKAPLLNMVQLTAESFSQPGRKTTLLATRATFESQVFQKELFIKGVYLYFDPSWQKTIDKLIIAIKKNIPTQTLTEELIRDLQKEHIESVIIGCTDLFFLQETLKIHFKCADSSQVLAYQTVKLWMSI